ncbi:MAG: hypothetical protein IMZ65_02920, partial [Planctomycetes bacterium]|nr:hypothetical protein [Planctomycetota bacterium]
MPEPTEHKTLRDFLRPVFRWWGLFSIGVAVAALAVLALTPAFWPVKYTATTKFLQQVGVASENLTAGKSESFDVRKQTLALDLVGSHALNEVFDELEKKYPMFVAPRDDRGQLAAEGQLMRAQLVAKLTPDLKVAHEVRSEQRNVVSVAFTSNDPGLAQELPNKVVELYIRRTLKDFLEGLTRSKDFLEMEKNKAGGELEKLIADKNTFEGGYEKQYGLPFPDSAGGLEEGIRRGEDKIESTQNDRKNALRSLERLKAYQERHGDPVPVATKTPDAADVADPATPATAAAPAKPADSTPPADPAAADHELEQAFRTAFLEQKRLEEDIQKYKRSLDEARTLSHMTDKHPTIVAMKKQIADSEKQIADTQKTLIDLEKRRRDQRVAPAPNGAPSLDPAQELARRQAEVERDRAELVRLGMEDIQHQIKDT